MQRGIWRKVFPSQGVWLPRFRPFVCSRSRLSFLPEDRTESLRACALGMLGWRGGDWDALALHRGRPWPLARQHTDNSLDRSTGKGFRSVRPQIKAWSRAAWTSAETGGAPPPVPSLLCSGGWSSRTKPTSLFLFLVSASSHLVAGQLLRQADHSFPWEPRVTSSLEIAKPTSHSPCFFSSLFLSAAPRGSCLSVSFSSQSDSTGG